MNNLFGIKIIVRLKVNNKIGGITSQFLSTIFSHVDVIHQINAVKLRSQKTNKV